MPDRTRCVACGRIGFVRREQVFEKGKALTDFYCGVCNKSWREERDAEQAHRPPSESSKADRHK